MKSRRKARLEQMSRNTDNHFGNAPIKTIGRSKFKMPFSHKTTFNTGDIVPIYSAEVLPGDTAKMHTACLVRMTTPINPVMDNAWMDTYYFFIPRRLVWSHWKEFMGENTADAWTQEVEYQIPQLTTPSGGWRKGTVGEKLYGIQGRKGSVDACYARAYALVYNEWFRNENLIEPAEVTLGDATTSGSNGSNYVTDLQKGGKLAKAGKFADYFTRALPEPQKGPDVYLPLGTLAPVRAIGQHTLPDAVPVQYVNPTTGTAPVAQTRLGLDTHGTLYGTGETWNLSGNTGSLAPSNLWADLSRASAATINQLRQAFAVQRLYERDALGGTRYTEMIKAHFGVTSSDARLQRPEYLGGKRVPINITQVIQQSSTDATSPQGNTAAYSLTIDNHDDFTKSFEEHGIILGFAIIRTEHTYQQGLNRKFSRKNRADFYFPELSNIGEQYIKNKEIYAQGTSDDEEAFGYQEAWAEYRYANNMVTGELNSDYAQSLDSWHYADDYSQLPTLSQAWEVETENNVARTLAIQDQDQWIADFYFDQTWTRPMPIYSVPSLSGWM